MFKVSCFEKKETQLLVFSADNRFCKGLRGNKDQCGHFKGIEM